LEVKPLFTNVIISPGDQVTITMQPGIYGRALISGMQIAAAWSPTSTPTTMASAIFYWPYDRTSPDSNVVIRLNFHVGSLALFNLLDVNLDVRDQTRSYNLNVVLAPPLVETSGHLDCIGDRYPFTIREPAWGNHTVIANRKEFGSWCIGIHTDRFARRCIGVHGHRGVTKHAEQQRSCNGKKLNVFHFWMVR